MLIGKEQNSPATLECPFQYGRRIAGRTHDAAVLAAERLQTGRRIDVGHRRNVLGIEHFAQLFPGRFNLFDGRHVRHRTARGHVRQNHRDALSVPLGELRGPIRQDVSCLGHEMDATEDDRATVRAGGGQLAKLITVAGQVRELDDLVLLVVVPQDEQSRAKFFFDRPDAFRQLVVF